MRTLLAIQIDLPDALPLSHTLLKSAWIKFCIEFGATNPGCSSIVSLIINITLDNLLSPSIERIIPTASKCQGLHSLNLANYG